VKEELPDKAVSGGRVDNVLQDYGGPCEVVVAEHDGLGWPSSARSIDECTSLRGFLSIYACLHLLVRNIIAKS
jgi:hypothetical protein